VEGSQKYLLFVNEDGGDPDAAPYHHIPPDGCNKKTLPYWRRADNGGILYFPRGRVGRATDFDAGEIARLQHQYLDTGVTSVEVLEPYPFHPAQIKLPKPPDYPEGK
jgi:hypothetical protein